MKRGQGGRDLRVAYSRWSQQGQGHWAREKVGDEVQTEVGRAKAMEGPEGYDSEFLSVMFSPSASLP